MQQHLMQMQPMMASYPPTNVTTDVIQQYLDENKQLILAILENQSMGKLSECAANQAKLQRNLMYLASIADSQPQPPTVHSQFSNAAMPPSGRYLPHQAAQSMTSQSLMAARASMLYGQQQLSALQESQAMHSQLAMNSGGNNGLHLLHGETNTGGSGGLSAGGFPDFGRSSGIIKQVGTSVAVDTRGGNGGGDGSESLYLKTSGEEGN